MKSSLNKDANLTKYLLQTEQSSFCRRTKTNVQQAVWQYGGWTLLASAFYRYQQRFGRTEFC